MDPAQRVSGSLQSGMTVTWVGSYVLWPEPLPAASRNRGMRIFAIGSLLLLCGCADRECATILCAPASGTSHVINIKVTDARGTPLTANPAITHLIIPAGAAIVQTSCSLTPSDPADGGDRPTCFVDISGRVVGHYEFDIGATGYRTQHATADVAAQTPEGCCPLPPYVPADVTVALSP